MKLYIDLCIKMFALLTIFGSSSVFARQVIELNTYHEAPLSNSEGSGLLDLVVTEMFDRIDYDVEISFIPAKRGIDITDSGKMDGHFSRVSSILQDYENLAAMNVPLTVSKYIAISKDDHLSIKNWNDLKEYKVGHPFGWKIFGPYVKSFKSSIEYYSLEKMIEHVTQNKIDVALGELGELRLIKKKNNLPNYYEQLPPLKVQGVYVLLHKSQAKLVSLLDNALLDMIEDGTWKEMCPPCQR